MPLEIDKPYTALRVAAHDSDLVFVPREGFCDDIVIDTPYIGLRAATHDGKLVYLISDQKLNAAGEMIINKPYVGLRVATHDGDLVYVVDGMDCDDEEENEIFCECEICCTLEATVQFPTALENPATFEGAIDATMTCGRSFVITNWILCQNDEFPEDPNTCTQFDQTYSGGTGSYVVGDQTFNWRTVVWVSDAMPDGPTGIAFGFDPAGSITFTGDFKVYFAATETTITEEGEDDIICCAYQWGILVEYTIDPDQPNGCAGTGWGFWIGNVAGTGGNPSCPSAVIFNLSECEHTDNLCCPEGYTFANPEGTFLGIACTGTVDDGFSEEVSGCIIGEEGPLLIDGTASTSCARLSIADLCEEG